MQEVAALALRLLGQPADAPVQYLRYAEALQHQLALDPLAASDSELRDWPSPGGWTRPRPPL